MNERTNILMEEHMETQNYLPLGIDHPGEPHV